MDVPTIMRVKKWALSFEELLSDETGLIEFELFLKKEYSHENIHFYKACKELIMAPLSKLATLKANIETYVKFLFTFTAAGIKYCVVAVKRLLILHHSADYIFSPLGSLSPF